MSIDVPDRPTVASLRSPEAEIDLPLPNEAAIVAGLMKPASPALANQRCLQPLERLKIDQSFIRPMDTANLAIVKAVIALGKTMGPRIITEGIETDAELALISVQDRREAQGYRISRPLSAADFLDWLRARDTQGLP